MFRSPSCIINWMQTINWQKYLVRWINDRLVNEPNPAPGWQNLPKFLSLILMEFKIACRIAKNCRNMYEQNHKKLSKTHWNL